VPVGGKMKSPDLKGPITRKVKKNPRGPMETRHPEKNWACKKTGLRTKRQDVGEKSRSVCIFFELRRKAKKRKLETKGPATKKNRGYDKQKGVGSF